MYAMLKRLRVHEDTAVVSKFSDARCGRASCKAHHETSAERLWSFDLNYVNAKSKSLETVGMSLRSSLRSRFTCAASDSDI